MRVISLDGARQEVWSTKGTYSTGSQGAPEDVQEPTVELNNALATGLRDAMVRLKMRKSA